ncbi:unnamed protein product [Symbiodinium sp. CCMP2456]|nr:unnamed protein product [Symbiodinium sp. CCMP2456]
MAVSRRSTGAGGLLCAIAVGSLLCEGFVGSPEAVVTRRVAAAASHRSRRFVVDAVAWFAAAGATEATAAPIQFNAQLAGDLSEAQKRSIKAYLEKNKDAPTVDVVIGERPMKVYVKPTAEELRPGSPEFKARVASVRPDLGERLIDAEKAAKMVQDGAVLVDVRTREEVLEQTGGELPKVAALVPLDEWAGRAPPPLMRGKKVVLTCFHGNKSVLAWESLRSQFVDAYVLDDGVAGWKAAGLSTRKV